MERPAWPGGGGEFMSDLNVSIVQAELVWHDSAANLRHFTQLLAPLAGRTDLIVLPEMFTSGFTMRPGVVAEAPDGPAVDWMREQAARLGAVITGSMPTRQGDQFVNRMVWMRPDGTHEHYDKRHLFRMAEEHQYYQAGSRRPIVELKGWRILPLVCYDLRFPVWSRNQPVGSDGAYDVVIYVANWPQRRRHAWVSLLRARAIENLAYCVGVNRVGVDGNEIPYSGDSAVLDYLGQPLCEPTGTAVETVTLKRADLDAYRQQFPAYLDADRFELVD